MEPRNTDNERIDSYLLDEMNEHEAALFEEELAANPQLRSQLETARHIGEAFTRKSEQAALEQLLAIGSEKALRRAAGMNKRLPGRKSFLGKWGGAIALTLACAAVALLIYGYMPMYSSSSLYEHSMDLPFYEPVYSRGGEEISGELGWMTELGGSLYEGGDFSGALAVYDKILASFPAREIPEEVLFYYGATQLILGNYGAAIPKLSAAADSGSHYTMEARWYLALAYLANGERLASRETLEKIASKEGLYRQQARELIEQIKTKRWF